MHDQWPLTETIGMQWCNARMFFRGVNGSSVPVISARSCVTQFTGANGVDLFGGSRLLLCRWRLIIKKSFRRVDCHCIDRLFTSRWSTSTTQVLCSYHCSTRMVIWRMKARCVRNTSSSVSAECRGKARISTHVGRGNSQPLPHCFSLCGGSQRQSNYLPDRSDLCLSVCFGSECKPETLSRRASHYPWKIARGVWSHIPGIC